MSGAISYAAYFTPGIAFEGAFGCAFPTSLNVTVPSLEKTCSYVFPAVGPSLNVHRNVLPASALVSGIMRLVVRIFLKSNAVFRPELAQDENLSLFDSPFRRLAPTAASLRNPECSDALSSS